MSTESPLESTIETAAAGPISAASDGQSATGHNLRDLIEADKHLAAKNAANQTGVGEGNNGRRGLVYSRFRRGGTT